VAKLPSVVVEAEQEARDPLGLLAPGDADDHAVRRLVALHLDDGLARAGHVRGAQALGDDAVEASDVEPLEPVARNLRIPRRGRDLVGEPLDALAALRERQLVHRLAVP
jgi:hypothetical protein